MTETLVKNSGLSHADRRRKESKEANALRLRAGQYLRRLNEIADRCESAENAAIPGLRLKADIYIKLLAKCLPDLKAIEHSGEVTQRYVVEAPTVAVSVEEWKQSLSSGARSQDRKLLS